MQDIRILKTKSGLILRLSPATADAIQVKILRGEDFKIVYKGKKILSEEISEVNRMKTKPLVHKGMAIMRKYAQKEGFFKQDLTDKK